MPSLRTTLLALLLAASSLCARAASPADPLWLRAVERARGAEQEGVVPGTVRIETVVTKKDGVVDHTGTVVFRTVDDPAQEDGVGLEVVSAVQDGEDVTAKAREADAEARRKADARRRQKKGSDDGALEVSLDYHPFSPDIQERVAARREAEESVGGRRAVRFAFRHGSASGAQVIVGKAWLDAETGDPLRVEASPEPLPRLADAMVTRVWFRVSPEGGWLPERAELSGEGGLLFIRRAVRSVVTFSDFRKKSTAH